MVFGSVLLIMEISTIFANARWLSLETKMKGKFLPIINSILLFTTYFVSRMIFHNWWSVMYGYPYFFEFMVSISNDQIRENLHKSPLVFRFAAFFMATVNFMSQLLNLYWFYLICKQVKRNVKKLMNPDDSFSKAESS